MQKPRYYVLNDHTLGYTYPNHAPDGTAHDIEGDAHTLAFINTKLTQRDQLIKALREALKLVNGDNTRQASDVLREQWERLLVD